MANGRFPLRGSLVWVAGGLMVLAGCTSPGPLTSRQNTMAMLKSSVSRLESSNQNLKKQVASLQTESNRIENQLAQERQANGELTARLDDAKRVIRQNGGDVTALNPSSTRASTATNDSDEIPAPARPTPVRRSSRSGRRPPAASIPSPGSEPSASATVIPGRDASLSSDVDPGPQASRDDDRWLPVTLGPRGRPGTILYR